MAHVRDLVFAAKQLATMESPAPMMVMSIFVDTVYTVRSQRYTIGILDRADESEDQARHCRTYGPPRIKNTQRHK